MAGLSHLLEKCKTKPCNAKFCFKNFLSNLALVFLLPCIVIQSNWSWIDNGDSQDQVHPES